MYNNVLSVITRGLKSRFVQSFEDLQDDFDDRWQQIYPYRLRKRTIATQTRIREREWASKKVTDEMTYLSVLTGGTHSGKKLRLFCLKSGPDPLVDKTCISLFVLYFQNYCSTFAELPVKRVNFSNQLKWKLIWVSTSWSSMSDQKQAEKKRSKTWKIILAFFKCAEKWPRKLWKQLSFDWPLIKGSMEGALKKK